jgi:hypothetical protein
MTQENDLAKMKAPSKKALFKATLIALVVAVVVLFTAVLPAEYGYDPLHTGAALGLIQLSDATEAQAEPAVTTPAGTPAAGGTVSANPTGYKIDSEEMVLHPGQGVEIKYHMQKGATMVYSWKANGKLLFEFHGEPDQKPNPDYYDSYELDDKVGKEQSHGTFIAPSTGIHGWFWEAPASTDGSGKIKATRTWTYC